jgi:hypothetical protein
MGEGFEPGSNSACRHPLPADSPLQLLPCVSIAAPSNRPVSGLASFDAPPSRIEIQWLGSLSGLMGRSEKSGRRGQFLPGFKRIVVLFALKAGEK